MTDHFHSLLIKVRGGAESYVLVGNSDHIVRDTMGVMILLEFLGATHLVPSPRG